MMIRKMVLAVAACWFGVTLSPTALAQVSGGVYTTDVFGAAVDGNIYPNKAAVYISGGPHNQNSAGLSPNSTDYYFMVTDPSGAILLSNDPISCRVVVVDGNGRVSGTDGSNCAHYTSVTTETTPRYLVQLCSNDTANDGSGNCPGALPPTNPDPLSYYDTTNPGGEYKVWLTPVANYTADSSHPVLEAQLSHHIRLL